MLVREFLYTTQSSSAAFSVPARALLYSCAVCQQDCFIWRQDSKKIMMNGKLKVSYFIVISVFLYNVKYFIALSRINI